jgi:hypothetical protein
MRTTKKIWDEKDARRHEIAPLVTKLFFQGKQLDPELLKELETLREFFNTHIDPQVDEIQLTGVMSLDLEKLTKIGDKISDCLVDMKELKIFMNSRNQDDEVTYEELQERYDTMYGEYEELRLLQINFQEKFLMTYDQSHKFYNPKIK